MLCLLVANQNNRTSVLPEPAAQMTRGDKLAVPLCPPVICYTWDLLSLELCRRTLLLKELFCLEKHLGNGMIDTSQMLSQCHHCTGVAKFS